MEKGCDDDDFHVWATRKKRRRHETLGDEGNFLVYGAQEGVVDGMWALIYLGGPDNTSSATQTRGRETRSKFSLYC